MKRLLLLLALSIAFCQIILAQTAVQTIELEVDGVHRQALVVCSTDKDNTSKPLVFVFHGRKGTMEGAMKRMAIHQYMPDAVVVYPQGLWGEGAIFKGYGWELPTAERKSKDIPFFDALLHKVCAEYRIDTNRIYAMGHSNGAGFTHALWALRGDIFAAFAPSASGANPLGELVERQIAKPVFFIGGEADEIVPIRNIRKCIDRAVIRNGCDKAQRMSEGVVRYPSADGNDIETYIHHGGHRFAEEVLPFIANFFTRHSKQ